jgi:hypothetical protein
MRWMSYTKTNGFDNTLVYRPHAVQHVTSTRRTASNWTGTNATPYDANNTDGRYPGNRGVCRRWTISRRPHGVQPPVLNSAPQREEGMVDNTAIAVLPSANVSCHRRKAGAAAANESSKFRERRVLRYDFTFNNVLAGNSLSGFIHNVERAGSCTRA